MGARRRRARAARDQNGFYRIWPRAPQRARPELGLQLAKIDILAVALALLRERRSYGLADLPQKFNQLKSIWCCHKPYESPRVAVISSPSRHGSTAEAIQTSGPGRTVRRTRRVTSGTHGFCGRGSGRFLPSVRCATAVARRLRPRRPRHLRGSSAPRRPQSLGRARRRRSGRRRASPTRSPTSSASSGWAAPHAVAA